MSEWDKAGIFGKIMLVCTAIWPFIRDITIVVVGVSFWDKLERIETLLNKKRK